MAFVLAAIGAVFLVFFALSVRGTKSILAPAPLWNICWALLFFAGALFGGGYIYSSRGVAVLAVAAGAFNVGCSLAAGDHVATIGAERTVTPNISLKLIWACAAASFVGVVALSAHLGTSILAIRSFKVLFASGQQNAVLLFRGQSNLTTVPKLCFAIMQIGFALAGARQRLSPSRKVLWTTAALVFCALLWSAVTTQRSYLLVPVVWLVGGYVAATVWTGRRFPPPRTLIRAGLIVFVLAFVVLYIRSIRTSGAASLSGGGSVSGAKAWVAGYIPAFSVWYATSGRPVAPSHFFDGITGLFGGNASAPGAGTEYISVHGASSNAPTMMLDLYMVGGPFVAVAVMIVLGWISHSVYRHALAGDLVASAAYVSVVAGIVWSPNAWFFGYGGRVLGGLGLIALAVKQRRGKPPPRRAPLGTAALRVKESARR